MQNEICDWLGINAVEFDGLIRLRRISVGDDRSKLSPEESAYVDQYLGFASEYFGYIKVS